MKSKLFTIAVLLGLLVLSSCENKNLFGKFHKRGSSGNVEVLLNDANASLAENDYSKAKEIADEILAKDPDNSEALYISASAELKEAGFDIAGLVTSVISSSSTSTDSDSLLETFESLDVNEVATAISNSVDKLKKIAEGSADGTISADDVDVNLNLGILEVLDAAINIVDFDGDGIIVDDTDDVVQVDENYNVSVKIGTETKKVDDLTQEDYEQLKSSYSTTLTSKVQESVDQVGSAINHLIVANESAGYTNEESVLDDLKDTIETDLKPQLNDLLTQLQQ
ncbi:MAG: hypothetical protein J7L54_04745 [Elusimicrobia bacterium]|nr:hypothetical protein [Elusimicrobiota bacterium]